MDAVKAAFPLKGEKQKKHYLLPSRFSPSQVILDVFHHQYEVIFLAGVCGSFRGFFIWQPAGLKFSGRRSGAVRAALDAARRESRAATAESPKTLQCFPRVKRESKKNCPYFCLNLHRTACYCCKIRFKLLF